MSPYRYCFIFCLCVRAECSGWNWMFVCLLYLSLGPSAGLPAHPLLSFHCLVWVITRLLCPRRAWTPLHRQCLLSLCLSLLLAGLLTKIAPPPFPPFYLFIFKHLHSLFCHPTRFQLPSFTSPLSASLWSGTVHVCTHLPRVVRCVLHGRRWRVGCSLSKKRMRMTFCEEVI